MIGFMYATRHVARLLNITEESIRLWTKEFAPYLSPTALPTPGRHRRYTDADLAVLALVSQMRDIGHLYEDIHTALAAGQRAQAPQETITTILEQSSRSELALVERGFAQLQLERDQLKQQIAELNIQNSRLEGQLDRAERELLQAREEIIRLHRENAKLELRLEQAEED